MNLILPTTVAIALIANSASGQAGQALRRAREVSNQNNVRQGVPSPAQTQPVAPAALPQTNGVTQAQSLAALQIDLAGFKPGGTVTEAQKQQFTINLAKAVRGNKPSLTTVKKFVDSLTAAAGTASFTDELRSRLAANLDAALNSRPLSQTQFDKIIDDTQALLQVAAIKRVAATSIAADLKAIGVEVRR